MWWRFIAPSILVLTLIVGILPAVQLGMEGSSKSFEQGQFGYKSKVGKNGTFIVLTQNAYQTMWIGHTWGPEIADEMKEREKEEAEAKRKYEQYAREHKEEIEQMKKEAARMAKDLERQGVKVEKPKDDKPGPAFLIIAYFLFVAAAIGLGYAMPLGTVRTIIFLSGTGLASLLLLIQVLIGFPLQSKFEEEMKSRGIAVANLGGKDVPKPFARQTIWLHLSWPILLGAWESPARNRCSPGPERSARRNAATMTMMTTMIGRARSVGHAPTRMTTRTRTIGRARRSAHATMTMTTRMIGRARRAAPAMMMTRKRMIGPERRVAPAMTMRMTTRTINASKSERR